MALTLVEAARRKLVEAHAAERLMSSVRDTDLVIEGCLAGGATAALRYPANLTSAVFDLSSGDAGAGVAPSSPCSTPPRQHASGSVRPDHFARSRGDVYPPALASSGIARCGSSDVTGTATCFRATST
jgi:hypothetical protein